MKKLLFSFLIVFVLLSVTALVLAQDLPNDPGVNEDANACYEGGTMEGRCGTVDHDGNGVVDPYESEWDFRCGWYLIRYQYNMIGSGDLPGDCQSLLADSPDTDGCNVEADHISFDLLAGTETHVRPSDNDCSFNISSGGSAIITFQNVTLTGFGFVDIHTLEIGFRCNTAGQPWSIKGFYSDANEGPIRISITGNCL